MGFKCIVAILGFLAIVVLFAALEWMAVRREQAIAAEVERQRAAHAMRVKVRRPWLTQDEQRRAAQRKREDEAWERAMARASIASCVHIPHGTRITLDPMEHLK